jgi:hypothetical protein
LLCGRKGILKRKWISWMMELQDKYFVPLAVLVMQMVRNITKVDDAFSFKCLKP